MSNKQTRGLLLKQRTVPAGGYKPREDAIDIFLTDGQLHAQKANHPKSLTRNIQKASKSDKLPRTFSNTKIRIVGDRQIEVGFGFDENEVLDLLRKKGKRMLRIYMPTAGVPVYMAQDALDKVKSLQRKHLLQMNAK